MLMIGSGAATPVKLREFFHLQNLLVKLMVGSAFRAGCGAGTTMICGGDGCACRTAVIEFAIALVCAAISARIARNSSLTDGRDCGNRRFDAVYSPLQAVR